MPAESRPWYHQRERDRELSIAERTSDFLLIDCGVWISKVLSAAQRHDPAGLVYACRTMQSTLQALGAAEALHTAWVLEQTCPFLSRKEMLKMSGLLTRETTDLVNRLSAQTCLDDV